MSKLHSKQRQSVLLILICLSFVACGGGGGGGGGGSTSASPASGLNSSSSSSAGLAGSSSSGSSSSFSSSDSAPQPTPVRIAPAAGPSADRPVFTGESGGVYVQPWGVAGAAWPEQLFWEDVQEFKDKRSDILTAADGAESAGLVPMIGNVAWGIDLTMANGGDSALGLADYSQRDGYKQYAAWMNTRKDSYFALNSDGVIAYPGQGYISFGMPMLPADISNGKASQTFGEWAGERVGKMAVEMHYRGAYVADYFIGLNYFTDWHPRLVDSFSAWANVSIPAGTAKQRHDAVVKNYQPQWYDFISTMQASYFVSIGKTLIAAGKQPRLGGADQQQPASRSLVRQ